MATDVYACYIGTSQRRHGMMYHLSPSPDEVTLIYPFYVVRRPGGDAILVDTGFSGEAAEKHGVNDYHDPSDSLRKLGIDPSDIKLIVVSHLHYDHFGVPERFPNAEFVMQADEIDYFTNRGKDHRACRLADPKSLDQLGELRKAGRVRELKGDSQVADGVRTIVTGGHTPGMQISVIDTGSERIVLACDAAHFYGNIEQHWPTAVIHNYENYVKGFDTIVSEAKAVPNGRYFPGHDPAMLEKMQQIEPGIYQITK